MPREDGQKIPRGGSKGAPGSKAAKPAKGKTGDSGKKPRLADQISSLLRCADGDDGEQDVAD